MFPLSDDFGWTFVADSVSTGSDEAPNSCYFRHGGKLSPRGAGSNVGWAVSHVVSPGSYDVDRGTDGYRVGSSCGSDCTLACDDNSSWSACVVVGSDFVSASDLASSLFFMAVFVFDVGGHASAHGYYSLDRPVVCA